MNGFLATFLLLVLVVSVFLGLGLVAGWALGIGLAKGTALSFWAIFIVSQWSD